MLLPWQQGSAPNILRDSIELAIRKNPLVGRNICGLSAVQADLVNFMQIFRSKFWALGGLNQQEAAIAGRPCDTKACQG